MKQEEQQKRKHPRAYYLCWIFDQYRQHKGMILLLLVLTIVSTSISVLFPIVFKYIIDDMVENLKLFNDGKIDLAAAAGRRNQMLAFLLALGLGPLFAGIYTYLRAYMNIFFEKKYREQYFSEVIEKRHKFFLTFRTGDLVTRLTEDVRTHPPGLSWLCCSGIFRAVNSSSIIFLCLVSMFNLNVKLTLAAMIPLPLMMFIFIRLEKSFGGKFKALQTAMSDTNDFLESAYSGIKIIKSFNAEQAQNEQFKAVMDRRVTLEVDVDKNEGMFMLYFEFLNYIGELLVLLLGGVMVVRGQLTIGTYYAFFSYLGMIVYPLMDIPMLLVTLAQSFVTIDRLEEITETEKIASEADVSAKMRVETIDSIEFRDVTFAHTAAFGTLPASPDDQEGPFQFRDISFELHRGEKIAVVGRIGSGKTTLLNLVAGVYSPDSGMISINGFAQQELDMNSYLGKVGYIQQEPVVFSQTIISNIDFWRGNERPWLESCAKTAQFDREIMDFPGGYDEIVGQRGVTLSGGQRQRLSIARAVARKPELLLMDDVTSSLDAANEQQLWKDLQVQFPQITCMIITHRLSTAQNADRIMVLDDGKIDAIGTHAELVQNNKIYQELLKH